MLNPFTAHLPLHSPFFVFIEGGQVIGDEELITMFGSEPLESVESSLLRSMSREDSKALLKNWSYAVVVETDRWKLISDDYLYTLWSRRATKSVIWNLA